MVGNNNMAARGPSGVLLHLMGELNRHGTGRGMPATMRRTAIRHTPSEFDPYVLAGLLAHGLGARSPSQLTCEPVAFERACTAYSRGGGRGLGCLTSVQPHHVPFSCPTLSRLVGQPAGVDYGS